MELDLLLIKMKVPIATLHIARLFSSLISSSLALDTIIPWVVSPTTLSIVDFTRSILSRLFTTSTGQQLAVNCLSIDINNNFLSSFGFLTYCPCPILLLPLLLISLDHPQHLLLKTAWPLSSSPPSPPYLSWPPSPSPPSPLRLPLSSLSSLYLSSSSRNLYL